MRNEAKYICCLGGFIGFLSFFTVSLLLGLDVLDAVIRGSVGCLFFSLSARGILQLILKSLNNQNVGVTKGAATSAPSIAPQETSPVQEVGLDAAQDETSSAVPEISPEVVESAQA